LADPHEPLVEDGPVARRPAEAEDELIETAEGRVAQAPDAGAALAPGELAEALGELLAVDRARRVVGADPVDRLVELAPGEQGATVVLRCGRVGQARIGTRGRHAVE